MACSISDGIQWFASVVSSMSQQFLDTGVLCRILEFILFAGVREARQTILKAGHLCYKDNYISLIESYFNYRLTEKTFPFVLHKARANNSRTVVSKSLYNAGQLHLWATLNALLQLLTLKLHSKYI
jgi:hypothetical protein